ncbi:MAG: hypothetical protein OEM18_02160 [Nitrosopumilus sp.]|nr:hypothetical protein [Nitrosopumilus sp.]MDH3501734.1 hypothetical protein [Nitrosopumilus sp.]
MRTSVILITVLITLAILINPALGLQSLDKVVLSETGLVNRSGIPIGANVNVNQQVLVSSKITNMQDTTQDFIYIVQIKNENDIVVKIGWITGNLTKQQKFVPAVSWVPKTQGTFTVEIYVWDGLDQKKHNYEALTDVVRFSVISS